jgi:hypothetical protein
LDAGDFETQAQSGHPLVAIGNHFREVVTGVDVHDWEGQLLGGEGLHGEVQEHGRVLSTGEQQNGTLALGHDFTNNEDCVGLEDVEVVNGGGGECRHGCICA